MAIGLSAWVPDLREGGTVLLRSVATAAAAGGLLWMALQPSKDVKTEEDEFAHYAVVGLSRSGKTAWAMLKVREWQRRGWGWCWLSIKGGRSLLPYLRETAADTIDLVSPISPNPRGINMLRLATDSPAEREQLADQTAEILDRLHPTTSDLMREMTRLGTLAVLEYGRATGREVSLLDLYRFFENEGDRQCVLSHVRVPPVLQAFRGSPSVVRTLEAVQRQVRRMVSSRSMLLALARTGRDQVDIRAAMAKGRGIVVDASDADLGPGQAALINEVIATKIQLYTAQRSGGEPGFGVIADEVQEYQGAGQSFRRALALAAEYRVAWVLVNQYREGQLNAAMQAAVNLAGSHVFFRLAPGDVQSAVRILAQTVPPDTLVQLEKRHYFSSERRQGKAVLLSGRTPDLPTPSPEVERRIRLNNALGPTGSQVLTAAYRCLEETEGTCPWT